MEDIKEKNADERIARLIKKCDECKMNECIGCEICWGDVQEIAELIEEKERYKYLYQKALSNTIMSDRELFKYKDTLKRYKELEEEVESQDKTIDNLIECQTEREKYTTKLEQDNLILANENLNSIPISVIQNKLEKFKREFDFYAGREHFEWQDGEFDGEVCDDISLKIGVLKEILEERNK